MTPLAKLTLFGLGAGVAYLVSKNDLIATFDLPTGGKARSFTPKGRQQALKLLQQSSLDGNINIPGQFAFRIVPGANQSGLVQAMKFVGIHEEDGEPVFVSDFLLDEARWKASEAVLLAGTQDQLEHGMTEPETGLVRL